MKRKFSKDHRLKLSNKAKQRTGINSPHWNGGRTVHSSGYILIRCIQHPNSRNGYIFEHRLIMEKKLNRLLNSSERIHHIDGNKKNNNISNLVLTNIIEHNHYHIRNKPKNCFYCKTLIKRPRKNQKYCSRYCSYSHRWNKPISAYQFSLKNKKTQPT